MVIISNTAQRARLKPRREPYWWKMGRIGFLGFRRTRGGGTWLVRFYNRSTLKQTYHSLGSLSEHSPDDQFDVALKLAHGWLDHINAGGSKEKMTVAGACLFFLESKAKKATLLQGNARRAAEASAEDQHKRLSRLVGKHRIADIQLTKLSKHDLIDWRSHLQRLPALVTRKTDGTNETKLRSASTLNRDMVPLRAALNFALENDYVLTDIAWRSALKPVKDADGRRDLYLDRDQRKALIEKLPSDLATFAHALCLLPLRPGALAKLTVRNFDARKRELTIASDKAGSARRILLPQSTSDFIAKLTRFKAPTAPLFTQVDGKAWNKDAWKRPIKAAAAEAKLSEEVTAYSLRHSTITDLVTGGLPLLTIAQISGTSAAMIEKHYGHLQKEHAADALAALAF